MDDVDPLRLSRVFKTRSDLRAAQPHNIFLPLSLVSTETNAGDFSAGNG